MHGRSCRCLLAVLILTLAPGLLQGQSGRVDSAPEYAVHRLPEASPPAASNQLRRHLPITPPGTIGFPLIARAAGAIFSGTVISIARHPATQGQAVETVAITFHVENAIRGATPGEDLTISQWIGLWSGGQRYRVGERVLLFLYPPSKLRLTSCVAGGMGVSRLTRRAASCFRRNIFQPFERIPSWVGRRGYVSATLPWRFGRPAKRSECAQKR
jgi:hypothetical protein